MYRYQDIREVHLEITTRCNAACPQCARNDSGGRVNETLPMSELSLDDVRAILAPTLVAQLEHVFLCGNYGDALVARDTLEVFRYLRGGNPALELGLHTNGSGRAADWWAELARLGVRTYFGIDGLESTNHLYRRGTDWARIQLAVRAFLEAGGKAVWNFLVFKHNEHQVEEAASLSRAMGFERFVAKRTNRFSDGDRMAVLGEDGAPEYHLEMPERPEWRNQARDALVQLSVGERETRLDRVSIRCQAAERRSLYVSAEGLVFPCCHTAHLYTRDERARQMQQLLEGLPGGPRSLDARRFPLAEIVEGPLFQEVLPERWARPSLAAGRPIICARVCGKSDDNMFAPSKVKSGVSDIP